MIKKQIFTLLIILVCAVLVYGAAVTHDPWDGTGWNTSAPNDEALVGNTYKEIYDLRKGVELRMNREHLTLATSSAGGWHLNGSAVCYEGTTEEPNLPDDSAALSNIARDRGRLWLDDNFDPPVLKRWDGSAFEVVGTIASGSAPKAYLISDANENTDGGRESKIIFKGEKDDDTSHELIMLQGSHDGTGDDYKADIILSLNDGDDAAGSLTEVLRIDSAKLATFAGAATVTGDVIVGANKLTVASATGNTVVVGTLGVTGASTFTAGITANGGVTLGAGDDLIGSATSDITINTNKFTVAGATGNTAVGGTLSVTGAASGIWTTSGATVFNTSMTSAATLQDLDLSGTIGSNAALVFLEVKCSGSDIYIAKPKGYGGAYAAHTSEGCAAADFNGTNNYIYVTVATDSSGIIQHGAQTNTSTFTIKLIGYIK